MWLYGCVCVSCALSCVWFYVFVFDCSFLYYLFVCMCVMLVVCMVSCMRVLVWAHVYLRCWLFVCEFMCIECVSVQSRACVRMVVRVCLRVSLFVCLGIVVHMFVCL